jgi:hypothetical protein
VHGVDPPISRAIPTPLRLDDTYNSLPTGVDVDVLHGHLLLAFAAVAVERFEHRGESAGKLVRLGQVFAPALEGLLANHGAPVAFHCRLWAAVSCAAIMPSSSSFWADTDQPRDRSAVLLVPRLRIGVLQPEIEVPGLQECCSSYRKLSRRFSLEFPSDRQDHWRTASTVWPSW